MQGRIKEIIHKSIQVKEDVLQSEGLIDRIAEAADGITRALKEGRKIWLCGNGGSAADAQHIAAELTGRFYKDRPSFAAEALHGNSSYLTAVANDYGFEHVYARMIEGLAMPGDILIAISTSGNSPNIINACHAARQKDVMVVGLTGDRGGRMEPVCDVLLDVPSMDTPRIQECHILIGHIICEIVENQMIA